MDRVDRDDFVHALGQTLAFYNKELDRMQTSFWVTACGEKGVKNLKRALVDYTKQGKFAPKPADILSIIDNYSERPINSALPPPTTDCPPEIAKAWMWFIGQTAQGSNMAGLFSDGANIDVATQERYLHLVNHEANKYCDPAAIPDEFKLKEVWG